uniref:OBP4 n=1 Tax=Episyrphus balteatus TaxID=286459 RepID=A0A6H0D665_EPIBA|nr:OBP4 [Episyrphus balteatus]
MDHYGRNSLKTIICIVLLSVIINNILAVNIDCNRPPPLVDPQMCCTDGGRDEVSEKCAKRFDISDTHSQARMNIETATCLAECVLTESNYLIGQDLNIAAIQADLQEKFPQDPGYVEAMIKSYQKCTPIAQRKLEELRRSPLGSIAFQRKCSPFSGIILGCTYTEYFHNCPAKHWNASEQCEIAKAFLQKCSVF